METDSDTIEVQEPEDEPASPETPPADDTESEE